MKNWPLVKPFVVQACGQVLMGALAWYWLGVGVGSAAQLAMNAALVMAMVAGWSWLDAYGLGVAGQWWRAIPAVLLTPLMGLHVVAAILVPLLWLVVLFPSVVAGKLKVIFEAKYMAIALAILLGMVVLPLALLNWIPPVAGLAGQAASFGVRTVLAFAIFVCGWAALLQHIGNTIRATTDVNTGNIPQQV